MRKLLAVVLLSAAIPCFSQQRLIDPGAADSAHPTATSVLRHLADGDIEAAARLSNAPQRRLEVLKSYRNAVGEDEFKRVFGRYFAPENRVVAEVAIGPRRLLVWHLPEAGERLAGQFFEQVDGRFLMDDMPSRARSELRRVLEDYRAGRLKY